MMLSELDVDDLSLALRVERSKVFKDDDFFLTYPSRLVARVLDRHGFDVHVDQNGGGVAVTPRVPR